MIINTKFEIGDKVYLLYENIVITSKIRKVITETREIVKYSLDLTRGVELETSIKYEVGEVDIAVISESKLFSTKQELLASL